MSYIYLSGAILCEVVGTMVLPLSENFSKPIPSLISIVAYVLAFYLLTFALESIPIAVVYATWSGLGIFLISFLGFTIYGQTLQWQSILGLLFIVVGVVLVNSFASVK
ncbi:SMR family transporter [Candidatus Marinimicrobia bacterium]|jgi:small multidrug resistance pump|nr:SMR family transporter [Candidatus Neomarinimicrobiota bacterium]MDG1848297.1 SMR family transporter [Candidatus Neomarinimicrobiota bacterium]|tara:strand:+ start:4628 stop:4951 length:324 start_codon:yes stop_codon:yes gene_type:complete